MQPETTFPLPLPDDPRKWDGWSKYKSTNLYERLCLDPQENPTNELIEEHCRELLRWWQKKLPLKNQPSNPIAQLLRSGLDESSHYLTQARVGLLDPERRQRLDGELAAQAHEQSVAEFHKYLTFALADGTLSPEAEKSLQRFGAEHGLSESEIATYIEAELRDCGATRVAMAPALPRPPAVPRQRRSASVSPREDFLRMLRLSGLDSDGMADETRDAFVNMAENLGLEVDAAEDIVDEYLAEADAALNGFAAPEPVQAPIAAPVQTVIKSAPPAQATAQSVVPSYINSLGMQMMFVPGGEFSMGSDALDATPNERPVTKVTLSRFYMSRFPVTNEEYEKFDPAHVRKRAPGAGPRHPVIHVSSLDAIKFCQSISTRERKKYRLPTEAEWEFAAKGTDGRKYPWGNYDRRGDLANFADRNTVFAWSDSEVDCGFAETSPVGAFPLGASPFGLEDMSGNVWEWCLDYLESYRGASRINPRGATSGSKRVYRGGSWKSRFNSLRTTARNANAANYSCNDVGFRVVCECE
ncbi:MAG: formylglycine-generating enzyme family protein [Verrucomicrobiota bacterium]|nr:formylglycine-generating enzyme family protein [Verrucomicrobiota bacterium]